MSLIDVLGTFRGSPVDYGISETKGGFPQFVVKLRATEYYDEDEKEWASYEQVEENEITAYLVLFGGNGKATLNCQQVMEVFGWDGQSFAALAAGDYSKLQLQFRTSQNTYENKTSIQVEWIDTYDAEPGRAVKKLDASGLKQLDAKYGASLKALGGAKKPAKFEKPKTGPKVPSAPVVTTEITKGKVEDKEETTERTPPPRTPSTELKGKSSKKQTWDDALDLKVDEVSDDEFSQAYVDSVNEIVGKKIADKDISPEQWFEIRELLLNKVAKF